MATAVPASVEIEKSLWFNSIELDLYTVNDKYSGAGTMQMIPGQGTLNGLSEGDLHFNSWDELKQATQGWVLLINTYLSIHYFDADNHYVGAYAGYWSGDAQSWDEKGSWIFWNN